MALSNIKEVPLSDIKGVSPLNVRHGNTLNDIEELMASIKRHGLLQPIVLDGDEGSPPYTVVAGQRRFLAHQRLNKTEIRAVFAGKLTKEKAILLSLTENVQAVELNHADGAEAITQLYEMYNKDERKVQKETGLSIQRIRDYLKIEAQATSKMKDLLRDEKVSKADVKRVLRAAHGNEAKAEELLELMQKYPLNKYQKQRIVEYGESNKRATAQSILKDAMVPRVEKKILISVSENVRTGLQKASDELAKEAEQLVSEVIEDWLIEQGFVANVA